jgi:hypothetical protein
MDPANILVARLRSRLAEENINRFFQQLLWSETLPGLEIGDTDVSFSLDWAASRP